MKPCPYIEIKYNRKGTWAAKSATVCALREHHVGLHLMQSGRELRKWAAMRTWIETEFRTKTANGAWAWAKP